MMKKINRSLAISGMILLLGLVSACGQKGDLYLPKNTVNSVSIG